MADRDRASSLSVRLGYEAYEWLAKLAQDEGVNIHTLAKRAVQHFRYWQEEGEEALRQALEVFEAERSACENERRRRLYFQRQYELQSRHLYDMLRDERHLRIAYQNQLRDERNLRIAFQNQLRDERNLRVAYQNQPRDERDYERRAGEAQEHRNGLYSPTVAKLLTLAIRSESDDEARTAVAKARALHRKEQDSMSDTPW
jgi:hypothetical protein